MPRNKGTGQPTVGTAFTPTPSEVDWKKLRADFEAEATLALQKFRDEIERTYQEKAMNQLNTSRDKYLEGLSFNINEDGVDVEINGWLPTAVEEGAEAFDMKPGLLAGRDNRVIRLHNGNFRTVSTKSPANSWWHPGIQAKPISSQVKAEEDEIAERTVKPVVDKFLDRIEI